MSDKDRWLLPEGIEEVLPEQAQRIESLRRRMLDVFASWGYELVMPPFIDHLESLLTGTGEDLELQTFKLTDQMSGRTMGVRADMTPQVARIDAHHLKRDVPVRLCYMGTVLLTRPQGVDSSRSPMQIGAELYGYAGIDSDAEILQLMLESLAVTGLKDVHVDVGHVGIYRGLVGQAGLDAEQEASLFDALQRKAVPEIDKLLAELDVAEPLRHMLVRLPDLNGDESVLAEARRVLQGAVPQVLEALDDLEQMAARLRRRLPSTPLYFDLAELRGYTYHTGVVFAAYVPGHGQAVAQGGRYDDIGKVFGRARPATGFSTDLKTLILLSEATATAGGGIYAPALEDGDLDTTVRALRESGERVVSSLPGQTGGAAEMGCNRELVQQDGRWVVVNLKQ